MIGSDIQSQKSKVKSQNDGAPSRRGNNPQFCILHFAFCIRKYGFTLAEMLVSMGIFLIFITIALGIYSSSIRAQRKTVALNRVQTEAQFLMEIIAKQIRTSTVDYSAYGGTIPSTVTTLRLRDQDNQSIIINFDDPDDEITIKVGSGSTKILSSNSVIINDLDFFISPPDNPFPADGSPPIGQPRVTVVMNITASGKTPTDDLIVQQTVPQQTVEF